MYVDENTHKRVKRYVHKCCVIAERYNVPTIVIVIAIISVSSRRRRLNYVFSDAECIFQNNIEPTLFIIH